ncbi:hypothetical protein Trydic_g17814 [Trypoxylus dichotomus]
MMIFRPGRTRETMREKERDREEDGREKPSSRTLPRQGVSSLSPGCLRCRRYGRFHRERRLKDPARANAANGTRITNDHDTRSELNGGERSSRVLRLTRILFRDPTPRRFLIWHVNRSALLPEPM